MAKKTSQKATKNPPSRKTLAPARVASAAPKAVAKKKAHPAAATPKPKMAAHRQARRRSKREGGRQHQSPPRRDKTPRALNRPTPAIIETGKSRGTLTAVERVLTRAEIAEFRRMLLEKRAEILGDVSTLHNEALNKDRRDAAGDLSSMPIHMADLGT